MEGEDEESDGEIEDRKKENGVPQESWHRRMFSVVARHRVTYLNQRTSP